MKPYLFFFVSLLFLLGMVSIPILVVAIQGFKTRKPFLISMGWFGPILIAISIPLFLVVIIYGFYITRLPPSLSTSLSALLLSVCSLVIVVFNVLLICFNPMKGYMAFGATYAQFRAALQATLERLQLPYEMLVSVKQSKTILSKQSCVRLTSVEANLEVSTRMGILNLEIDQKRCYPLLTKISDGMNQYFNTSSLRPSMIPFAFYLLTALGVLAALMASATVLFPKIL